MQEIPTMHKWWFAVVLTVSVAVATVAGQVHSAPRPAAPKPGTPPAQNRTLAPDGYAPIPQWLGQTRAPRPEKSAAYKIEMVAEGFVGAFSFNFLPDGRMIVAERTGHIKIVGKDGRVSEVGGLPANLWVGPQQGIFEARPDRAFATNRTLYIAYAALPDDADRKALPPTPGVAVVVSAKLSADDSKLENIKLLLNAEGTIARVIQAPDGTLLVPNTVPSALALDAADWPQPQQLDSNMGKVLRINTDGSIPKDNPYVGRAGAHPEIFAIGVRDPQGVTIQPRTGKLWQAEHGVRGGDEINVIEKGKNYGFPVIGYGREYDGRPINGDKTVQDGMEQPVYFWTPDIAPAGIAFYGGNLFPEWRGNLFVSALAGRSLVRLVLNGERVTGEERLLTELKSRIRGVNEGPDQALYVLTDGATGAILRLTPGK
jgi:glucose/arabinose dehydrogenase